MIGKLNSRGRRCVWTNVNPQNNKVERLCTDEVDYDVNIFDNDDDECCPHCAKLMGQLISDAKTLGLLTPGEN